MNARANTLSRTPAELDYMPRFIADTAALMQHSAQAAFVRADACKKERNAKLRRAWQAVGQAYQQQAALLASTAPSRSTGA